MRKWWNEEKEIDEGRQVVRCVMIAILTADPI